MMPTRPGVRAVRTLSCVACLLGLPLPALAQLDPLLFLKDPRSKPNVIVALDVSNRMQMDADGAYHDPRSYPRTGAAWETPLGISGSNTATAYRRVFVRLRSVDAGAGATSLAADRAVTVGDLDPRFATLDAVTRLSLARKAIAEIVRSNRTVVRFGLVTMRQMDPQVPVDPQEVVTVDDASQSAPTETGEVGRWRIVRPAVTVANGSVTTPAPALIAAETVGGDQAMLAILEKGIGDPGAVLPAGLDPPGGVDAPLDCLLQDARAEAARLIALDGNDLTCRNTVVILVTGGGEGTTAALRDPSGRAASFLEVSGHRVPLYVVAIAPDAAQTAELRAVATSGGGQYAEITKAMIGRAEAGGLVPEFARMLNCAVQQAFAAVSDVNTRPSAERPYGPTTWHTVAVPVVGTVNLSGAVGLGGSPLPDTVITSPGSGVVIPQHSNVMITAGFGLPGAIGTAGFPGVLSAFRVYRPAADPTRPAGYRFVADGTQLWNASLPAPDLRNIYTASPDGTMIPFTVSNAAALGPWLNVPDPIALIADVRQAPLGAIITSTPAILDPPSLDPPPDSAYPAFAAANARRRGLVFVGANDGMLHAFDARLGVEVWAFIPFNLLPRLRALRTGQAPGSFSFFVDASPKLADLRTAIGWRTVLVLGEGAGGTFYQALDVTLDDMAATVRPDDNSLAALGYFSRADRVSLRWSFPSYRQFDYTAPPYGDLRPTASEAEKTVGQTWSLPAIGESQSAPGRDVVLVGSGFLPPSAERTGNRFPSPSTRSAGTTFYMLDAATGELLDSRDVGSDGQAEAVEDCGAAGDCTRVKNALQADVAIHGPAGSRRITAAYVGDLDGRLWRFAIGANAGGRPAITDQARLYDAGKPIFSSLAVSDAGLNGAYIFFATGSDRLPFAGPVVPTTVVAVLAEGGSGRQQFSVALDGGNGGPLERVTAAPVAAGDVVFFTTLTQGGPCAGSAARTYAVNVINGRAAYDTNHDGRIDSGDSARIAEVTGVRSVTAPSVADGHVLVAGGTTVEVFGDPAGYNSGLGQVRVRILSWRVVRPLVS
jgi:outer membrane protein assembly factor BamB